LIVKRGELQRTLAPPAAAPPLAPPRR
jgi:hypothetical protein